MTRVLAITALTLLAAAGTASAQTAYGVTDTNFLYSWDVSTPGTTSNVAITGLGANERILGIDARPLTGTLVIMTTASQLYTLGTNGVATAIGSGFTPALDNVSYGIDFNPTVDRLRVVNTNGNNRRLNPVTGAAVATDTALSYASGGVPAAVGTAYRNFQFGANAPLGSVRQYIVDHNNGSPSLAEVGSQAGGNASFNGGICTPVGSLGISGVGLLAGFDIFGPTDIGYVSLNTTAPSTGFYTINLSTGAATLVGAIASGNDVITDITIIPAPGVASLLALAGLAAARRRR